MVIGDNGPLSPEETTTLMSKRAAGFTHSHPLPSYTTSLASQILTPDIKESVHLTSLARMTEIGAGIPLESISARFWGYLKNIAGIDAAVVGGYSALVNKLKSDVESKGAEIKLNEEVVEIEELGEFVQIKTKNGESYSGRFCVSTIPLGVLQKELITFKPSLSDDFKATVQRTQVGVLEKVKLILLS